MKINSLKDVNAFKAVIDRCVGDVWLESVYGDKYNLKSDLSRYIAMAELLQDHCGELELFARLPEDEALLRRFLSTLGN